MHTHTHPREISQISEVLPGTFSNCPCLVVPTIARISNRRKSRSSVTHVRSSHASFFTGFYVPTTRRLYRRNTRWPHRFSEQNEHSRSVDDRRVQRGASFASGQRLLHRIPRSTVGGCRSRGSLLPLIVVGTPVGRPLLRATETTAVRVTFAPTLLIVIVLYVYVYAPSRCRISLPSKHLTTQQTARLVTNRANFSRHVPPAAWNSHRCFIVTNVNSGQY